MPIYIKNISTYLMFQSFGIPALLTYILTGLIVSTKLEMNVIIYTT
jgi:hypothetical protein